MVPVGASTDDLAVAEAGLLAERHDLVPGGQRRVQQVLGIGCSVEPVGGVAVLAHDLQVRLAVHGVAGEGAALVAARSAPTAAPPRPA